MKSYILSALFFCSSAIAVSAQNGKVDVLYVDGSSHVVQMSQVARLEVSGDDVNLVAADGSTVASHKIADVDKIQLGGTASSIASLGGKGGSSVTLRSNGYTVTAEGLADGSLLGVYTTDGVLVAKAVSRGGTATLDLSHTAAGVYVFKADGKSMKMVKR